MVMANIGIIPIHSVLYDDIVWGVICPMGIPLLLLQCNLKKIWKETGKMLAVFLCGSLGTILGAFIAYYALHGFFGNDQGLAQVASMMTGSYIGGGVNFAAMASQYNTDGTLVSAATVADNLLMALYFFVLIAFAGMRFFRKNFTTPTSTRWPAPPASTPPRPRPLPSGAPKEISLRDIAMDLAYAIAVVWVSTMIGNIFSPLAVEGVTRDSDGGCSGLHRPVPGQPVMCGSPPSP